MEIIKALKMRIYPNEGQKVKIDKTIGSCRFIYNQMLDRNKKAYNRRKEHLTYNNMQNLLPIMKDYLPWLKEADSQALKYACRQVDVAYKNFFAKRTGFPKFKSKKKSKASYTTTNKKCIDYLSTEQMVKLPFLGWMKCSDKRVLKDYDFKYATISKVNDKYYVSITYSIEKDIKPITINENQVVGLDYKSDGLYADNNGFMVNMPHYFRQAQAKLKSEQRKLRLKQGFKKGQKQSNRFKKQLIKVTKLQEHIANQRKDFLHKLSAELSKDYNAICIEDLNMKSLSNKGFGNGKATLDNAWGMFTVMLDYKLQEQGKQLLKIDKFYPSSQTCSVCGCVNKEVKNLSIRKWECPNCGATHDRDINAAVNIRNEGLRLLGL